MIVHVCIKRRIQSFNSTFMCIDVREVNQTLDLPYITTYNAPLKSSDLGITFANDCEAAQNRPGTCSLICGRFMIKRNRVDSNLQIYLRSRLRSFLLRVDYADS